MSTPTRAAALYLRSSKDRHDVSPAAQRQALQTLAAARGLMVVAEYCDVVESGKDENRPGFQQLIRAVRSRARGWSTLLVLDTSRIARRRHIAVVFEEVECRRHGVTVVYRSLPESDPISEMLLKSILQAMDEWHSLTSRAKGLAGMAENVRAGFRAGGRAPVGYQLARRPTGATREGAPVTKSKLEPSARAGAVRAYLEARAADVPRADAARRAGLELSKASLVGVEWNALTYAGHTCWNVNQAREGTGYDGKGKRRPRSDWTIARETHPALITDDQAERILSRLEAYAATRPRRRGARYLLSGILRTPAGRAWWGEAPGCYRVARDGGGSRQVGQERLERAVVAQVMRDLQAPAFVRGLARAAQAQACALDGDPAREQRARVPEITGAISRMMDLAGQLATPGPALRKVEELERERVHLLAEISRLERDYQARVQLRQVTEHHVRALLVGLEARIRDADRPQLKDALVGMIERIELDPDTLACTIRYRIAAGSGRDGNPNTGLGSAPCGDATLTPVIKYARAVGWR